MNYGYQGSTETSSEENDQQEQVKDYNSVIRSYECTFCKRGFTNAQALGGHMNIHRKDRSKTKKIPGTSSSINKPDDHDQYMSSSCFMPISNIEQSNFYPVFEAQRNCHMYFQPPNYVPSHESLFVQRLIGDDLLGANLSLRIGSTDIEDVARMKDDKEELDLELRLGHYPYP